MARIELIDLAHSYRADPKQDADYALRPFSMAWRDGGAYALLGPSGCGKTTLLNIISGLIKPSHGKVLFDGRDVTHAQPEARNIAQVFQFPVIYDTMTVFDNLAFPLRNRKMPESVVRLRVQEIAEILELTPDLKHRASGLTADAKQKISLGRGLVRKDVAAVLFDEPLTVIDPHLKWVLRRKLKQIHHQLKLSLIYVTHDQVEALTFADEVVVMYEGQVVQQGTAQELFETPAHTFVGYFIGSPGMNLLPISRNDAGWRLGDAPLPLSPAQTEALEKATGEITLGVRPEFVHVHASPREGAIAARLVGVEDLGTYRIVTSEVGGRPVRARLNDGVAFGGGGVWLSFEPGRALLYADGKRVG